jgi:hypothetical protein
MDRTFELCLRAVRQTKNKDIDAIAKDLSETLSRQDYKRYWTRTESHWWWDPARMKITVQSSYV